MSNTNENGTTGKLFQKVNDPMSLFPIVKNRMPHSCCLLNQLLAYETFKDNFVAYTFEETTLKQTNGLLSEPHNGDRADKNGYDQSNLWILFNSRREDWNRCITISSPTPKADQISSEVKYALEYSEILDWEEPFVFLNVDPNVSDYLINLNLRKFGNVIKIYPCYLFCMDPSDAAQMEVPPASDPLVKVAPLDPIKGADFLMKTWDYGAEGTRDFVYKCVPNHVSAGVYLPNGELACAAFVAPYGNVCCLVTHEDHRRKGYASLVMRYIFRELGKRGFYPCLETGLTNHAGVAFHTSYIPNIIAKVDYICHKAL